MVRIAGRVAAAFELLLLVSLVSGACSAGGLVYDPTRPARLTDTRAGTTVVLARACADCPIRLSVSRNGSTKNHRLNSIDLGFPIILRVVSPRVAIAIGNPTWFAYDIVLFDPDTGAALDEFVGYHPSISRDGKYIAFFQFYQAHGPHSVNASDKVEVYDTELGAAGKYSHQTWDRGPIVYPSPPDGAIHRRQSEIAWLSNSAFSYTELVNGKTDKVTIVRHEDGWSTLSR